MGQAWSLVMLVAGVVLVVSGLMLVSRSLHRLQRTGAFRTLYWAQFRRYAGYRIRSLPPVGGALLGIAMVVAGFSALYLGVVGFYAGRLGVLSG